MYAPSPDPDSLRCFLEAARRLNFREAAQAVHLTPAALGKRIQQLEQQLGVSLFQRTTRRVELTTAGLSLLAPAREALAAGEACVRAARGEGGPPPLELVLGTRHELGMSWILPLLSKLEQALPHLTLHLYVSSGPDLELRVRGGEVDVAVSSRQVSDPKL
ncbi:MAG: LysR family transcriptional regulator, partial [Planctomycetes bacterium]|nr:LysR family transcriptional regulator [Planctomycetota bacterium]